VERRQLLLSSLKEAFVGIFSERFGSAQEDLDPIKLMPDTHTLLFENEIVRVIESKLPVGGHEPKHRHPHCVTVYLADVNVEIKTFPDGNTSRVHRSAGTAGWSEATVHEVKNIGNTSSHNIRVELKC
jgi:hypothetical protein